MTPPIVRLPPETVTLQRLVMLNIALGYDDDSARVDAARLFSSTNRLLFDHERR
jgi:hypothetical protein